MGQSIGLEVDADDIEELLEDHSIKLTTEDLVNLQNEHSKNWLMKLKKKMRINKVSHMLYLNKLFQDGLICKNLQKDITQPQ